MSTHSSVVDTDELQLLQYLVVCSTKPLLKKLTTILVDIRVRAAAEIDGAVVCLNGTLRTFKLQCQIVRNHNTRL
jgi:hypothetical protein